MAAPKYERVTEDPAVQEAIQRVVDEAPRLTIEQIAHLQVLLRRDRDDSMFIRTADGAAHARSERLAPRPGVVEPTEPSDALNDAHAARQGHSRRSREARLESGVH